MYERFFGLIEAPFSIAPNPRYLYMSDQHKEALAHLFYGVQQDGGFVVLTGEVGTGKTTVCRCFLEQLPPDCDVAFILNSKLTQQELLETLCDELDVPCPEGAKSAKPYVDVISRHLLEAHSHGRKTLLIIDEAQNLSPGVLEQIRLLTNLETNRRKLLQIVLVGQPELQQVFALPALRQLSQRVTARYHLRHLEAKETWRYICHRMEVAGCRNQVIPITLIKAIMKHTGGIPRLINVLCDRMLLGAYVQKKHIVTPAILREAVREVFGPKGLEYCADRFRLKLKLGIAASLFVCAGLSFWLGTYGRVPMQALGFTKAIHPLVADTGDEAGGATDALSNDNLDNSQSDSRSNNAANSTMETATRPLAPASSREPYSSRLPENPLSLKDPSAQAIAVKASSSREVTTHKVAAHEVSVQEVATLDGATHERAAHEGTRGITNNHVDTSQLIEQNVARGQVGRDALSHANPSHRVDSPQPVDSKRYDADTAAGVALSTLSNRDDMELRSTPGPILWPDEMALADSQPRAVTTLLNLWGKNVGVGAFEKPCDAANRAQLACVSRKAQTIMDIRQLNRPVILTVADPRKGLFLATLASLNQDYAVLHVADHKVVVSARVLTQQWTGEYVLFWQAPSNYDGAIVPGAVGPKVFSFSRDLGRVMGSHSLAQGVSDFGIELEMAVRDFQRRQGLIVDGIAGVQTLVSMNTILLKGRVPTLSTGSTDINRATRTALRKS